MLIPAFSKITKSPEWQWEEMHQEAVRKQHKHQKIKDLQPSGRWEQQPAFTEHLLTQIPSRLTQLMGEFFTQDGHRGADALENRRGEGGANRQAINKVV